MNNTSRLTHTADIIANFVANHQLAPGELPALIASVGQTLESIANPQAAQEPETPKATMAEIRKSITPNGLISFEDGKTYAVLTRHLKGRGLTMAEYRAKWGLPHDYPATAPAFSQRRSQLAKASGLGARGRRLGALAAPAEAPTANEASNDAEWEAAAPRPAVD